MNPALRVTALAQQILSETRLLENVYFSTLSSSEMTLDTFRRSQQQFFYAVRYYSQPIASLVSRISDPRRRLDLVHNLVEEHGEFDESQFHPTTFAKFLATIGTQQPDDAGIAIGPVVHAFNATLTGVCASGDVAAGISCLGIIELAFASVSATIGRLAVERGWVPADQLVHYALHAELDVEHAQEFFALVEGDFDDAASRLAIEAGLRLGAYAFDRLYRDLAE